MSRHIVLSGNLPADVLDHVFTDSLIVLSVLIENKGGNILKIFRFSFSVRITCRLHKWKYNKRPTSNQIENIYYA